MLIPVVIIVVLSLLTVGMGVFAAVMVYNDMPLAAASCTMAIAAAINLLTAAFAYSLAC